MMRMDTFLTRYLRTVLWLLLLMVFSSCFQLGAAENDPALDLAREVYDRPTGKDTSSSVLMVISGKRTKTRKRQMFLFGRDKGEGERWSLMRFAAPADIKDTGLMTLDHPGDNSDQWLYLPALDRVRRISSSRKGGRFVGSDFFYEDLRDREVDMDRHRLAGKGKVGGILCEILVSTPIDPDNSLYSKRVSWIHRKSLVPLRVDFYKKKRDKPFKRLRVGRLKKIAGYWTVLESTMSNLKTGSKTSLITTKIQYNQGIPDSLFSRRGLSDPSREKKYQP